MKKIMVLAFFAIGLMLVSSSAYSAQSSSVAGSWDAGMDTPGGVRPFKLVFKVDGEKLTGTVKRTDGEIPLTGTVKGNDISFSYVIQYNGHDLELSLTGRVTGDNIAGSVSFGGQGDAEWSAKRIPVEKPKTN